jgi:hypothetical protein
MKDFIIVLSFMAVVFAACDTKKEDTAPCDTSVAVQSDAASPDATPVEDATTAEDTATVADAASTPADATEVADILGDGFPNVADAVATPDAATDSDE